MPRKIFSCCCWRISKRKEKEEREEDTAEGVIIVKEKPPVEDICEETDESGNPRNKCSLQPGHSLMDWIRLGASGRDLTGMGSNAGYLSVTKEELSKHNKIDDIWLAIRGRVYNVTAYIPFHPGGPDELMKAAGIDATSLFDQVHPWVNYEQILQKCLLGKLVTIDPKIDTEKLFFGKEAENNIDAREQLQEIDSTQVDNLPTSTFATNLDRKKVDELSVQDVEIIIDTALSTPLESPRFDWIQKLEYITVIFYTGSYSNPLIEVQLPQREKEISINISYNNVVHRNRVTFLEDVEWPCTIKMTWETGKVEVVFKKKENGVWSSYGTLQQSIDNVSFGNISERFNFIVKDKVQVTHNIFLMKFIRTGGGKTVVPIGKHVRVFMNVDGMEWSRSYTPVPLGLFNILCLNDDATDEICLMIKRYETGSVSPAITDKNLNDVVYMTNPVGDFDLRRLEKKVAFLILAAGTGITPMLPLMLFLLERRVKKCQFVRLLFFNRTEEDIPFKNQLSHLQDLDSRLVVNHILSEPETSWTGLCGHISKEIISNAIQEHIKDTGYTINDIFSFICGPNQFSELSLGELRSLQICDRQIHTFSG